MVRAEDDIIQRTNDQSGACTFVLRGAADPTLARAAMQRASEAVYDVPHPAEPDDPLPNFVSDLTDTADGPSFWIDCKDQLDDPQTARAVVNAILGALNQAGADGLLCVIRRDEQ